MRERRNPPTLVELNRDVEAALMELRDHVPSELADHVHALESYIAVAQRVLAKTNPSKIRDAATVAWIQALMPPEA